MAFTGGRHTCSQSESRDFISRCSRVTGVLLVDRNACISCPAPCCCCACFCCFSLLLSLKLGCLKVCCLLSGLVWVATVTRGGFNMASVKPFTMTPQLKASDGCSQVTFQPVKAVIQCCQNKQPATRRYRRFQKRGVHPASLLA